MTLSLFIMRSSAFFLKLSAASLCVAASLYLVLIIISDKQFVAFEVATNLTPVISAQHQPNLNCTDSVDVCVFRDQILSKEDRQLISSTLQQCSKVLHHMQGIAYFLYDTSLNGYCFHNASLVPWEDFVHLALVQIDPNLNATSIVRQFIEKLETVLGTGNYLAHFDSKKRSILCYGRRPDNSRYIRKADETIFWRWPYIEIKIMDVIRSEETGNISRINDPHEKDYSYPAELILPVKLGTFHGASIYLPNDPFGAMDYTDNFYWCHSRRYNRSEERKLVLTEVPCKELRHLVNFTNYNFEPEITGHNLDCEIGRVNDDPSLCLFMPLLNEREKTSLVKMIAILQEMLDQVEDADNFIFSGSLVGYWRHNGTLVPWDDDVDFAIVQTNPDRNQDFYVDQLERLVKKYPGYGIYYWRDLNRIKMFGTTWQNSQRIFRDWQYPWRYPFIDILFVDVKFDEHRNVSSIEFAEDEFKAPSQLIYPLRRALFESTPVWVPNDILGFNKAMGYDLRECKNSGYNHRFEIGVRKDKRARRPCSQLKWLYTITNVEENFSGEH